jgi:hypothetical protein
MSSSSLFRSSRQRRFIAQSSLTPILLALAWRSVGAADPSSWREAGFADFADGHFSDGGANTYVSAAGRVQIVNRWDFNGDGFIDILSANTHPLIEMLDMSVYWGNGHDYSIQRHSYVPANGPMWVSAGDFNRDGKIDLAVANYSNGTWTNMDSAVYWGDNKPGLPAQPGEWLAPPFRGKTMLPTRNAQGVINADLNRDGYPELIFALSAGFWEYRGTAGIPKSRIYWNRQGKFSPTDFAELGTNGATKVDAADINGDGWIDLAFSNGEGPVSYVYLGSSEGFSEQRRIELPTAAAHSVRFADINGDGAIDVLFANEQGPVSFAYLNHGGTYSAGERIAFDTHYAKDVVVADFNRDGLADVFFTNHMYAEEGEARFGTRLTSSYLYYGSKSGFSREHRQSLQTIGAWGANAADLNGDGWVDILVCNFQEHYSFEVPSFIYWNGPQGFDVTRRTPLYEHGAQGNTIADFNADGHPDILITSMMGRSRGDTDPSYLYLGNARGQYSVNQRVSLPGHEAYEQAMADLDDDGKVDVVLMNQGEVTRYENEAVIFWNKDNQLDPWRTSGLPAYAGVGVEVADLDRDGYLDLIVANNRNAPDKSDKSGAGPASYIYWGSRDGFAVMARTGLSIAQCRSPSIVDLNGDGHLDLVFGGPNAAIFFGNGTRDWSSARRQPLRGTFGLASNQTEVADLNRDGFPDIIFAGPKVIVYYGNAGASYAEKDRVIIDVDAKTITVADVNQDGWLDLVCPRYKLDGQRTALSSIMLGSGKGFSLDHRIQLPTDGGTGSLVSDFNFDGYNDVFFYCHRTDGDPEHAGRRADHQTDSRLYWGSATGFDAERFLRIPTVGAHYDMGVDLGHIMDRRLQWEYESSSHDAGGARWSRLTWQAETPGRTAVRFQVRAAATPEELRAAPWQGPTGPGSYFEKSGTALPASSSGRWVQYKAVLDTFNGAASPVLTAVQIDFH